MIWKSVPNERLNHLVKGNHQGVIVAISAVEFASLENVIADAYEKGEDLCREEVEQLKNDYFKLYDKLMDIRKIFIIGS